VSSRVFNFALPSNGLKIDTRRETENSDTRRKTWRRSNSADCSTSEKYVSPKRLFSAQPLPSKKLIIPNVLNFQPSNVLKGHSLSVGNQTIRTLSYMNYLHRKENQIRKQKNISYPKNIVIPNHMNTDFCITASKATNEKKEGLSCDTYGENIENIALVNRFCSYKKTHFNQGKHSSDTDLPVRQQILRPNRVQSAPLQRNSSKQDQNKWNFDSKEYKTKSINATKKVQQKRPKSSLQMQKLVFY